MAETQKSPEELAKALVDLGVKSEIVERLRGCPEVMELLLFVATDDDAQVDRVLAEIRDPSSEAADHLHADLFRYLKEMQDDMRRPSMILQMRRDTAAEALAKATTDEERAEIEAFGKDRSLDYSFSVTFEPDEDGSGSIRVRVPCLKGCNTCGDNMEDARAMAADAIKEWLSVWIEDDKPVPTDSTVDADGKSTLTPEPGQTVEVITVTVEVPAAP